MRVSTTIPDPALIAEVRALTPLIRRHRDWSEEHVRIAPAVHDSLGALGIFRLAAPTEMGGLELDSATEIHVYEELAYADPAVAWIAMNSNAAGAIASRLKPAAADRVFASKTSIYGLGLVSAGKAVAGRGGFRVSGRWPVVSGCNAADWFLMASKVYDGRKLRKKNGKPVVRFAIVPASEAEPLDTWSDVVAVRGSGSHAVSVPETFVDRDMTAAFEDRPRVRRPRYLVPPMSLGSIGMAAVSLGIARFALEAAVAQGTSRKSALSGTEWRTWPSVQDSVASIDAAVYAGRAGLFALSQEVAAFTAAGKKPPPEVRAHLYAYTDHAVRLGRDAVSRLFTVGSVDAIHQGHGLERALRDMHGFSVQWERSRRKQFQAGAALLGAEIEDPQF